MAQDAKFFLERAEEDARLASSTDLSNVRDRALRSEKAWRAMAARVERVAAERRANEENRAQTRMLEEAATATA